MYPFLFSTSKLWYKILSKILNICPFSFFLVFRKGEFFLYKFSLFLLENEQLYSLTDSAPCKKVVSIRETYPPHPMKKPLVRFLKLYVSSISHPEKFLIVSKLFYTNFQAVSSNICDAFLNKTKNPRTKMLTAENSSCRTGPFSVSMMTNWHLTNVSC